MPTVPPPVCLTPEPGHYLFGYYDRQPWDATGRYHLALRIPQQDRLPLPGEAAEVGVVDLADGCRFRCLGTTRAWNHQQGAMTQWLPHEPGAFVVNDAEQRDGRWHLFARVLHVDGRELRRLPLPTYILAPDGYTAATLDFGRIFHRPGYSYAVADARDAHPLPDDVGVWTFDVRGGQPRLIASIRQLAALHPAPFELEGRYVWLNHLGWNCDGSRLMVLLRYCNEQGGGWKTFLYTLNPDGSAPRCALPHWYWRVISHQLWGRTPREIIVDADWRGRGAEFVVFDDGELTFRLVAPGAVGPNGHVAFSPDGQWLVADTYPHGEPPHQLLRLVHVPTARETRLLTAPYPRPPGIDRNCRCDLHPRWRADGRALSFDSVLAGDRKIYSLDLTELVSQ
jgi:hypothetical protein